MKGNWMIGLRVLAAVAISLTAADAADGTAEVDATLAADGRTFAVSAPGFSGLQGGFSARLKVGEEVRVLASAGGKLIGPVEQQTEETPYGRALVSAITLGFGKEPVDLLYRIGRVPGMPGVLARAGIRNSGPQPVNLLSVIPMALSSQLPGSPADWLVTNLHPGNGYMTRQVADIGNSQQSKVAGGTTQLHVWEGGGLYRRDGTGFLFGPVGTPIAYVNTRITHGGNGGITLDLTSQMDGVRVDPGETRWSQQVVLLMEKPQAALARWAGWVGTTHGARTAKGALSGWSSWYFLAGDVTGKDVLDVAGGVLKSHDRLRPAVIQIDGGYENPADRMETNDKFPEGLAHYAQRIAVSGARPGLQVGLGTAPDLPIHVDSAGWAALARRVRHAVDHGFTYLKLDFYGASVTLGDDPKQTNLEQSREGFAALRKAAGDDTYLLYCDFAPNRSTVGFVDASRTGRAATREGIRNAMTDVLRSYQLHDRWFAVDNCNYYMGTDIANVSRIHGGWPLVRTWMSMVGMSCGAAITSDPWQWESFEPYLRNVEAMTPPATERTEVIDLGTSPEWPRLVGQVRREWGDASVVLLWNPGETERAITLDFAAAGIDPHRRQAVWSFWDNRYLGVARGSWTTPAMAPGASQHLRFTDLDRTPNRPILVGSNLHIYCGAAETKRFEGSRDAVAIELTDAGARDGDLFVYSRFPLVLNSAAGCAVTGIAQAGEYMWRISLAERRRGAAQRVELNVLLPVTRQLWFWLLIALVVVSLMLAAWRYVVNLRFQRELALNQERTRIARDLHDEIGAKLSRISLLGAMATEDAKIDGPLRREVEEMADTARATHRAFAEIVWAVNPRNDTVRSLAHYICRHAEEFFDGSPVSCLFSLPDALSDLPVQPKPRHQLFLAVKEGLNNILKHAAATQVNIAIRLTDTGLGVELSDNGRGFDPALKSARGDGLRNMHERMRDAGGTLSLVSNSGVGTRLTFEIPLKTKGPLPLGGNQ